MHALLYAAGTLAPRTPLSSTNLPCVGLAATPSSELLVVGTAHTPCQSAAEVEAVITAARPDVVVLELDPERLERLLLSAPGTAERRYGADFAAAAKAARDIGVPMVLGDVKARDTAAALRAAGPLADTGRVRRALSLALRGSRPERTLRLLQPASVVGSLRDDPAKLLPLLAGAWWTVLLGAVAAFTMPVAASASVGADADWLAALATAAEALADAAALALAVRVPEAPLPEARAAPRQPVSL